MSPGRLSSPVEALRREGRLPAVLALLAVTSFGALLVAWASHDVLWIDVASPQAFYLPIVLASFFLETWGILFALVFAACQVGFHLYADPATSVVHELVRSAMFLFVAGTVSSLALKRRRATEALDGPRAQYHALLASAGDLVFTLDISGRHTGIWGAEVAEGRIDPARFVGRTVRESLGSGVAEVYEKQIQRALAGELAVYEWTLPSGASYQTSLSPLRNVGGEIEGVVGICRDQTAIVAVQRELRASEERYRGLFTHLAEGLAIHEIILDDAGKPADYRFLDVNPAFERQTGLEAEVILGKRAREVLPTIEDYLIETYGRVATTGVPTRFISSSPETGRWYDVVVYRPVANQFATLCVDVTEAKVNASWLGSNNRELGALVRKRTAELEETHRRLVRKERLAALGTMAASVSHDLRNPLSGISNALYLLEQLTPGEEAASWRHIRTIRQQAEKALRIVGDILLSVRESPPDRCPGEMNSLVTRTICAAGNPPGVVFDTHLAGDLPPVRADWGQLERCLDNLASNALQAMPGGGVLSISTSLRDDMIEVRVADTGIGISPDRLAKVFDPLYTTRRDGTGLGLAIAKAVAEAHGGSIAVDSEPGKGSAFTLRLPRSPETIPARTSRPGTSLGDADQIMGRS